MKKLIKFAVIGLAASLLAGCDFPFGSDDEEEDTTVYHTVLAIAGVPEELITENNYKIQAVTYSDDFDDDELHPNEPTYGYVDATYQSRVDLKAPYIPGYKFMGYTDDQGGQPVGFADTNIKDGYDLWWNQYQHNGVYTANYQLWSYTVVYGLNDGQSKGVGGFEDGYKYDITQGAVTIPDGSTTNLGETFNGWYYVDNSTGERVEVDVTELPTDYFESTLCLFGRFEVAKYKISVEFDNPAGVKGVTFVDEYFTDGTKNPHIDRVSELEWNVEAGYYSTINVELEDNYRGAGVYIDGEFCGYSYVSSGVGASFNFNHLKDITVRFELFE